MRTDKEKITKEAREILEKFSKALENVEKECPEEYFIDRKEFVREEKEISKQRSDFKERVLNNSPKHDSDFIISERGAWKNG